jgi:pimeloyl-ACP methyl ester carboxylesterase
VWGEEDRLVPVELARSWVDLLPRGTLATFPDAGHLVLDESPEASAVVAQFCGTSD